MGLDQSAGKMMTMEWGHLKNKETGKPQTYEDYGPYDWRKHARLHMFMKDAWHRQNQDAKDEEVYHFTEVELQFDDIDRLQEAIDTGYIEYFCEGGFFFGHQFQEDSVKHYKKQDLEFVEFAKIELSKGNTITYRCSW
jgi:hypothetical protein